MTDDAFNLDLLAFLSEATTPFHAVSAVIRRLRAAGFEECPVGGRVDPASRGVFVTDNDSSIIAYRPGTEAPAEAGIRLVGAHTDSPCLMLKPRPERTEGGYRQLGVEVYGGALLNPWFDRDLSLAGRVSYRDGQGGLASSLVDFREPIAVIPNLAIHLDREANRNRSVNAQTDMAPILGLAGDEPFAIAALLRDRLRRDGRDVAEVLAFELNLYDTQPPAVVGLDREFIASARLDNLLSCFVGLRALVDSGGSQPALLVCNDHEEVGSRSAAGADGPFLQRFLQGLCSAAGDLERCLARSVLISADNAHGVHPNYPDKHDGNHGPMLGGGPVIKVNASQRYASNSRTAALFRVLADAVEEPVQSFAMRADMACGSTIGPITASRVGVPTLDVGVPTFAMHSLRELAGCADTRALYRILGAFYDRRGPLLPA